MARAKLQLKPSSPPKLASAEPDTTTAPSAPLRRKAANETRPDREGTRMIGGHLPQSTWSRWRMGAVKLNRTTQDMLCEAIDDFFAKHNL